MTLIDTRTRFGNILQPVIYPEQAKPEVFRFGANLTIPAGTSIAQKTADNLAYPFASGASDGTQLWKAFNIYSLKTDANGRIYYQSTASALWLDAGRQTSPGFICGYFAPEDVTTALTPTVNVVTLTAGGTIEVGDLFITTYTYPNLTTKTITYAATATTLASVTAGIMAAWNADVDLALIATATNPTAATVVLTAVTGGINIHGSLTVSTTEADGSASDSQTYVKANTTAAAGRALSDIVTSVPGARITTHGYWNIPA